MLVSARGAAEILRSIGLGREEARRLLLAGFAGPGERTPGTLLYQRERVRSLTTWQQVEDSTVDDRCPAGLFVGRISRSRSFDATADWRTRADAVSHGWHLSLLHRILISTRVERYGPMPFVATFCDYVALGAGIVDVTAGADDKTRFTLAEPGGWFEEFAQRRLLAGAGRSCFIWDWPPQYRG